MDGLDLLKKDWNKQPDDKKFSVKDIYSMLHKKSSSIVKTLFYISIAELVFWIIINAVPYFCSQSYKERLEAIYTNDQVFTILTILSYGVILIFIFLLYKSYKSISVTDSAKKLMESILKTRKVVKYYVLYNLVMAGVSMVIGFYYAFHNDSEMAENLSHLNDKQMLVALAVIIVFTAVFILMIWLFYKLIYGLLLKRLNKNYKELKKLDED